MEWISVDEHLPETDDEVLVWYEYFRHGRYNRMVQTYGLSQYIPQTKVWLTCTLGTNAKVLYWMPLPKAPTDKS